MWVSRYLLWFCIFSVAGWVYETIYCTCREHSWQNRGFLYGPYCPIYGVGACGAIAVYSAMETYDIDFAWWHMMLVAFFGSMVLEYVTSWGLEKLFHARWWDYSDVPLNVNGRICLPASIGFAVAGLLIVYVMYPPILEATNAMTPWVVEAISLVVMAVFSSDTTLTAASLTRFAQAAEAIDAAIDAHMERFVADVGASGEAVREAATMAVEEERERFGRALRERRIADMGHAARSAARRVKHMRPRLPGKEPAQAKAMLELVKRRLPPKSKSKPAA